MSSLGNYYIPVETDDGNKIHRTEDVVEDTQLFFHKVAESRYDVF
jgi:hypothetical protein